MNSMTLWQVSLPQPLAFFDTSVVEIVNEGQEIEVPYCHDAMGTMLIWREQWIPVLRFDDHHTQLVILKVAGVSDCPYLAMAVESAPVKVSISDEDFSNQLNEVTQVWQPVAISAVKLDGEVMPIVNPSQCLNDHWLAKLNQTEASMLRS